MCTEPILWMFDERERGVELLGDGEIYQEWSILEGRWGYGKVYLIL